MKQNNRSAAVFLLLTVCFAAQSAVLFFVNPTLFLVSVLITLALVLTVAVRWSQIKKRLSTMLTGVGVGASVAPQSLLTSMEMPALVTDSSGCVLWYNDSFRSDVLKDRDVLLEDVCTVIPDFNITDSLSDAGFGYKLGNAHYTVFSSVVPQGSEELYISLFACDTVQHRNAEEFLKTRPSVLLCTIDNYDELGADNSEGERAEIVTEVYRLLEDFINETNGVIVRVSSRNFLAIIEEQHIQSFIERRFPILDQVRAVPSDTIPPTLSIGVGRGAKTLFENSILARQALDMALGRGGDQAAMKTRGGYEFYGGETRAVEKRNKVKARVIASAMCDLIANAKKVAVVGHKSSDLDSLGAAVGVTRIANICGVDARIVFDRSRTLAGYYYEKLIDNGYGELFINPVDAEHYVDEDTLLVIVDCHTAALMENAELLQLTQNIMLIDHHRKMVGYIDNTVLSYHEPYASSCSELVAELIQLIEKPDNGLEKVEADGLLAGIMLDTKDFTVRTGVRTYEAASYLRRQGADPTEAHHYFATDIETYRLKSELVTQAAIYRGCAIVVTDKLPDGMRVVVPQAADDLLNIEGVQASIVAVVMQNRTAVSSRSLGGYNVQLIMEQLGGGGHQTMAGAQLEETDMGTIEQLLRSAVDTYIDEKTTKEI